MKHTPAFAPSRRQAVMVLLLALALLAPAQAAEARARGRFHASLSLSATVIPPGGSVVASGSVTPVKVGKRITLQADYGQGWETAARGRIRAGGYYRIVDHPRTLRARNYRVVVPGTRRIRKGVSNTMRMRIAKRAAPAPAPAFKWYDLYDLTSVDYDGIYETSSIRINGGYYTKSLYSDGYGVNYREYNLSRLCTQLTTTLGLSDESESGAVGEIRVLRDGGEAFKRQFSLGQAQSVTLDMTNTLRLRFEVTGVAHVAYGAAGSPKVYCRTSIEAGMND